jgi:hypothetical protein
VILEVDENQHKSNDASCEYIRMFNIAQSLGGTPTRFIRYNPDEYRIEKHKRNPTFTKRADLLRVALRCAMQEPTSCLLSVKYMFFDQRENTDYEKLSTSNGQVTRSERLELLM